MSVQSVSLYYREGSSDKEYHARIEPRDGSYVVNFAYGRRGTTLQTGTKTNSPVDLQTATRIFGKLVTEKKQKGYTEGGAGTPYQHTEKQDRISGILPQLLNPIEEPELERLLNDDSWCMQEKFDGKRVLVQKIGSVATGINRKGLTVGLPLDIVRSAQALPGDFILDGECVGEILHAFDVLVANGEDVRTLPYRDRLTALLNILGGGMQRHIKFIETAYKREGKSRWFKQLRQQCREGVVFKKLDAPYTPGRPNSGGPQLKFKFYATCSAVVAAVNARRSVELRLLNGEGWVPAGNVTVPANQCVPKIGDVVEVRYLYAFPESGALFQPTLLGLRSDIGHHECTCSQLKYKASEEEES